jgi:hypothetical protein
MQWSFLFIFNFKHFHEVTPTPTRNIYTVVDCRLFASPAQSASQNPLKAISLPPRYNLKSKVPFQTPHDAFYGHPMQWTCLRHEDSLYSQQMQDRSSYPSFIYMRNPTPVLYGTYSIFLCTFPNSSSNKVMTGLQFFILKCSSTFSM